MNEISLTAAGQSQVLDGTVRITASVFASHHLLPSDTTENLLFRETDIAMRMYRTTQLDIVTRHVTDLELGVFAARSYLDRAGWPKRVEDLLDHDLVGYDRNDLIVRNMQAMGWSVTRDDFVVRCDNQATYWELVRAGCGIGFSQTGVASADPLVEELTFDLGIAPLPVWLAAHQAMRQTPRIRRVWDLLAEGLRQSPK